MKIVELKEVLMEVPVDVLKYISSKYELESGNGNKEDMVDSIVHSASQKEKLDQLILVAKEYRYAGRHAVDWFQYAEPKAVSLKEFEEKLIEEYSTEIFVFGRMRPALEKNPKAIFAEIDRDRNQMLMMFAYNGPVRRILVNYEPRHDHPTYFDYAMVKFDPLTIEVRASFSMSKRIMASIVTLLGLNEKLFQRIEVIGDKGIEELRRVLEANVQLARHQSLVGDYDWIEVMSDPEIGNLLESKHYQDEISKGPSKRKIYTFKHTYSFGHEEYVTLEVNTELGRFWFRSAVGEEVIQRVLQAVKKVTEANGDEQIRGPRES